MNPIIKQVLGEHETESGKLPPQAVMYLGPEQVASEEGCHCGRCIFFDRTKAECFLTTPPACDAEHGVCGLYIGGPSFLTSAPPQNRISKEAAGYVTEAPTQCANCEYYQNKGEENGPCAKVEGQVSALGCCNGWEKC